MGLFDFLIKDNKKDYQDKLFLEEAKSLGLEKEEIEDCLKSGLSPTEWLKENEPENYHDQELDD